MSDDVKNRRAVVAAESHSSMSLVGCTSSSACAKAATSSRPAIAPTAHRDPSTRRCFDAVPGARIVISGYWTGPDMDDACCTCDWVVQSNAWHTYLQPLLVTIACSVWNYG